MIRILKASAGSGKTYNLAKEYIRLIVESDKADAYRHILAVTFTNKATDEMKRRILKELNTLAKNPSQSRYLKDLTASSHLTETQIQKKAQQQISGILHDYSAFAVSTIDKFFQQTLRAFSREIGQFSSYQVQLDREELVAESVDRVLDGLSEEGDRPLLEWLTRSVQEDLRTSGRFSLEGRLTEVAASLKDLPKGRDQFPREALERMRTLCKETVKDYQESVVKAAQAVLDTLGAAGVDPADTNRGFLKSLYKYRDPSARVAKPSESFMRKAMNPDEWFSKGKQALKDRLHGALDAPLEAFLACFGPPYRAYKTAFAIQGQLYSLGVAGELRDAFTQIQREKNVISLDDSNTILSGIIDGSSTPFVYEKLGVRFDNFLLDEFQDTSVVQWENFRPLLQNSDAAGCKSLVVGDVKQSIYRWRGGDWDLLDTRLEQEFRDTDVTVLDENWRTCRSIVDFNNAFFRYAAAELDRITGAGDMIQRLYADVSQTPRLTDPAPGSVEVLFTEDQMEEIIRTLRDLHGKKAEWSDIAILVRGNREGSDIAAALVAERIPVVSDDSLFVKTSVTVRRLVSQLSLVDAPPREEAPTVSGFLARSMQVHIPSGYHSLVDLAEKLLRDLRLADPVTFDAEIPYIQSFMDYLSDWVSTGGNNLDAFLRSWKDASPKIASPARGNSVRVMTIHKSKGLEFPFVIVPFAEKVTLYKASAKWCEPEADGSAISGEGGIYRVQLDTSAEDTLFQADYRQEHIRQAVDNINVFYVALTRAKYGLKVIAARPPKDTSIPKNLSHILYNYLGTDAFTAGESYPWHTLSREEKGPRPLETGYASYPADSGERLRFSPEAADYFGPDGSVGAAASNRIRGSVLHGILSRIGVPEDLPGAVDAAVSQGELSARDREETLSLLGGRITSVADRGWFAPGMQVLREAAVLSPDGNELRPDRVVIFPDGSVAVVDYKFGAPKDSYLFQVRRYVNLYRKMGYRKVEGYLWYLEDNLITFVS